MLALKYLNKKNYLKEINRHFTATSYYFLINLLGNSLILMEARPGVEPR